ncbi:hypothetical protein GCK32_022352 [Trichostrongylus colubriformis]|uniref:ShKT domain-containing protein n=1 Tax=Trichostrongylus colubriformis TaxID=6319 RepID=A0AAN8IN28_TRICO
MWFHYFLCLALLVEFTNGGALLSKLSSKITGPKKKNENGSNDVIKEKEKVTDPEKKSDKATVSGDAPWCQDAIDEWDCEEYKSYGYCNDIYGKHYHMCEKTCTNGTCKSPFL